jgi:hypothetical protein
MAIEFTHQANSADVWIRVTRDVLVNVSCEQFVEEMSKATREFVQTDPEVRILINEMVRGAFGQVDLLKLVTDTIKQSLPASIVPAEPAKEALNV